MKSTLIYFYVFNVSMCFENNLNWSSSGLRVFQCKMQETLTLGVRQVVIFSSLLCRYVTFCFQFVRSPAHDQVPVDDASAFCGSPGLLRRFTNGVKK